MNAGSSIFNDVILVGDLSEAERSLLEAICARVGWRSYGWEMGIA